MADSIQELLVSKGWTYNNTTDCFERSGEKIPVTDIVGHSRSSFTAKVKGKGWLDPVAKEETPAFDLSGWGAIFACDPAPIRFGKDAEIVVMNPEKTPLVEMLEEGEKATMDMPLNCIRPVCYFDVLDFEGKVVGRMGLF